MAEQATVVADGLRGNGAHDRDQACAQLEKQREHLCRRHALIGAVDQRVSDRLLKPKPFGGCGPAESAKGHQHLQPDFRISRIPDVGQTTTETIFRAALAALEVEPEAAAMVGDSLEDDIEGARALGMRALLVDREGRYPDVRDALRDLYGVPAALGLPRS